MNLGGETRFTSAKKPQVSVPKKVPKVPLTSGGSTEHHYSMPPIKFVFGQMTQQICPKSAQLAWRNLYSMSMSFICMSPHFCFEKFRGLVYNMSKCVRNICIAMYKKKQCIYKIQKL